MSRKIELAEKIDKIIGIRIHKLRIAKGISQQQLGEKIGVTFQQVAKYENAINRVSGGRLMLVAKALNVNINYFFNEKNTEEDLELIPSADRICIAASRNFMKIKNQECKDALNSLLRVLGKES